MKSSFFSLVAAAVLFCSTACLAIPLVSANSDSNAVATQFASQNDAASIDERTLNDVETEALPAAIPILVKAATTAHTVYQAHESAKAAYDCLNGGDCKKTAVDVVSKATGSNVVKNLHQAYETLKTGHDCVKYGGANDCGRTAVNVVLHKISAPAPPPFRAPPVVYRPPPPPPFRAPPVVFRPPPPPPFRAPPVFYRAPVYRPPPPPPSRRRLDAGDDDAYADADLDLDVDGDEN
jgi:hypothetical protein